MDGYFVGDYWPILPAHSNRPNGVSHVQSNHNRAEFLDSQILGLSRIYAYTLLRRTTKFGIVTHMGRDMF